MIRESPSPVRRAERPDLPPLYPALVERLVLAALAEDLGEAGDRTTDAVVPADRRVRAEIRARADGRIAGLDVALTAFRLLDPAVEASSDRREGAAVASGERVATLRGLARPLLSAERTALNLLGHLSGIATATDEVCRAIAAHPARVVCTRKTTPLLRGLEKRAVAAGGGLNHRFGLHDGVLIKDNHRLLAGGAVEAIQRVRQAIGHMVKVEVEIDELDELDGVLAEGVDAVLLDNMGLHELRQAVARVDGRALTEASGGITPEGAEAVAATGVDLLSLGWLTHSAPALDVGLDLMSDDPDDPTGC